MQSRLLGSSFCQDTLQREFGKSFRLPGSILYQEVPGDTSVSTCLWGCVAAHFIRMLLAKTFHRVVEMVVWQLLLIRMSLATFSFSHVFEVAWQHIFSGCPQQYLDFATVLEVAGQLFFLLGCLFKISWQFIGLSCTGPIPWYAKYQSCLCGIRCVW